MSWLFPLAQGLVSLASGVKQSQGLKKQAELVKEIGEQNANELLDLTQKNIALRQKAGRYNADSIMELGIAQANAIVDNASQMYEMAELKWNYEDSVILRSNLEHLGNVRAIQASSGIVVETGTPLAVLNKRATILEEGRFMKRSFDELSSLGMMMQASRQATLAVESARQRSKMMEFNMDLEVQAMQFEANAQANAMRRSGAMNAQSLGIQATSALWGSIGNAIGYGGQAYGLYKTT